MLESAIEDCRCRSNGYSTSLFLLNRLLAIEIGKRTLASAAEAEQDIFWKSADGQRLRELLEKRKSLLEERENEEDNAKRGRLYRKIIDVTSLINGYKETISGAQA
jgi:hypothetical protein